MTDSARKTILSAWQNRKKEQITHPYLNEKVSIGLLPYIQSMLLARFIRKDIDDYPVFLIKQLMFVLITYDVNITSLNGAKRLRNVAKACLNHGKRVQNSVFECVLTESQYIMLKSQLENIIDSSQDSIRFYLLGSNWKRKVETIGKNMGIDVTGELII